MPKSPKPFVIIKRTDAKTFRLMINFTSGLPERVCAEWRRRSFLDLPEELSPYRTPQDKICRGSRRRGPDCLPQKKQAEGSARRVRAEDITVGTWIEKFTAIETSPSTGVNASRNRPHSPGRLPG
jgi:hypothetical protein